MSRLREYLEASTAVDAHEVVNRLLAVRSESSNDADVIMCILELESRLEPAAWDEIAKSVLLAPDSPHDTRTALRRSFARHLMAGPIVDVPPDHSFGRAIGLSDAIRILVVSGIYSNEDEATIGFRRALRWSLETLRRRWATLRLNRHKSMFGTYDPHSTQAFGAWADCAESVRCLLGLGSSPTKSALVLMEFERSPGGDVRIPTVADAFVGAPWNALFRPAAPEEEAGYARSGASCEDLPRRREVVLSTPSGEQFTAPIRNLR